MTRSTTYYALWQYHRRLYSHCSSEAWAEGRIKENDVICLGCLWQRIHLGLGPGPLVTPIKYEDTLYNRAPLEVDFANALFILQKKFKTTCRQRGHLWKAISSRHPDGEVHLLDRDGDPHEIVVRIVQIPDKF